VAAVRAQVPELVLVLVPPRALPPVAGR